MTKPEKKQAIVEYFKDVPVYKYAAMHVGIDEDTLILWRKEDTDFSDKLDLVKTQWVQGKVKKAKVEFALERLERDVFGPKQEIDLGTNTVQALLRAYGITEGEGDATKTDEPIQSSSDSQT